MVNDETNRAVALLEVEGSLYYKKTAQAKSVLNEELLLALKRHGIHDLYLFRYNSVCLNLCHTEELVKDLDKRGFKVHYNDTPESFLKINTWVNGVIVVYKNENINQHINNNSDLPSINKKIVVDSAIDSVEKKEIVSKNTIQI